MKTSFLSPTLWVATFTLVLTQSLPAAKVELPSAFPGTWQVFGRATVVPTNNTVTIGNGFVADLTPKGDCEMSFRARAPKDAEQVQIWCALRVKDRDSRYVVGLRGGLSPEVTLSRYAPEGDSNFYGFAPLDFTPTPGEWYTVRVAVAGNRFQIFLNDDALPRINVEVQDNPWPDGGVALGGAWLPAEFSDFKVTPLTADKLAAFQAIGTQTWAPPAVDKEAVRTKQRAAYQPAKIESLPATRTEISLDGQWLFMPEQSLSAGQTPTSIDFSDQNWHVIPVPSYWTPSLGWLHGENGFPNLKPPASSNGPADQLVLGDFDRVNAQTFDWKSTKVGWYRHYLDLPQDVSGKQFQLNFDAIAKISDVWVNGVHVGSHVGMFGELDCDITAAVKPGHNVIAVRVIGIPNNKIKDAYKVQGEAVTEAVTNAALLSLPHGMQDDNASGIWQPVKLLVTSPVRVGEIYIQPKLDGASAQVEILNGDSRNHSVTLSYTIQNTKDQTQLDANPKVTTVIVPAKGKIEAQVETPKLQPKLWSPQDPNLYTLDLQLAESGTTLDEQKTPFGFRTFTVDGSKLMLNGKPYWLRGGNHFPVTIRPNDSALAYKFIQLAREGNVQVTRSHAIPFTETWFKAADELGMGVSYEGTWTWLMLKGPPPSPDVLAAWKSEFIALMRKYRNHPSLFFWTVNNEMNFAKFDEKDPALLKQKWTILDDAIKGMRQADPTRPIVAYSNYRRSEARKSFDEVVTPYHFDDGDIDDSHNYFGWYNESFFHLFKGEYGKEAWPNRPLISQEMSTGYPRDDGWSSRGYEFSRYVPEALVGNYAFEGNDPSIFLTRQAFMTKELAEVIRRTNRAEAAGVMHFAYLTWFTRVWKADEIKPAITYYELKKALQAVLVSAELFGRHFYAGDTIERRVCLVNDAEDTQDLPAGKLTWEIRSGDQVLAQGSQDTPAVPYYTNQWLNVDFAMPATLPQPRVDAKLVVSLAINGQTISTNDYDIVLATKAWANAGSTSSGKVQVFDPAGKSAAALANLDVVSITSMETLSPNQPLIIGDLGAMAKNGDDIDKLKAFVGTGGKVLVLQGDQALVKLFPDCIKSFRKTDRSRAGSAQPGEIVSMHIPESPVFDEIEPLDMSWFEMGPADIPYACSGTYAADLSKVTILADQCDIHGGLKKGEFYNIAGYPLLEIHLGDGFILASEMMLSVKDKDPIAGRLLSNMIAYLAKPQKQ